jgi:hypothetical protein
MVWVRRRIATSSMVSVRIEPTALAKSSPAKTSHAKTSHAKTSLGRSDRPL